MTAITLIAPQLLGLLVLVFVAGHAFGWHGGRKHERDRIKGRVLGDRWK